MSESRSGSGGYSRSVREWMPVGGDRCGLMSLALGMFESMVDARARNEWREIELDELSQSAFGAAMEFLAVQFRAGALQGAMVVTKVEYEQDGVVRHGEGYEIKIRQFPAMEADELVVANVGRVEVFAKASSESHEWSGVHVWDVGGQMVGSGWVLEVRKDESGTEKGGV